MFSPLKACEETRRAGKVAATGVRPGLLVEGVRLDGQVDHFLGNLTNSVAVDSLVCDSSVRRFNQWWWLNGVLSLRCGLEFVCGRRYASVW